jgi:uncharacterized membrane protein
MKNPSLSGGIFFCWSFKWKILQAFLTRLAAGIVFVGCAVSVIMVLEDLIQRKAIPKEGNTSFL